MCPPQPDNPILNDEDHMLDEVSGLFSVETMLISRITLGGESLATCEEVMYKHSEYQL